MPNVKNASIAVNLTPELQVRIASAAEQTGIAKNALARLAIEGAVEAIEDHGGKLVIPIKFEVKNVPVEKKS